MTRSAGLAALALGLAALAEAHEPRPSQYTYWGDVRPLLERHCTSCHSPGGAGPMSLVRYRDILPWAAGIQRELLERRMPPWAPEDGSVTYRGERLLSAREIDILVDWITGATPEGDAPAEPFAGDGRPLDAERSGLALEIPPVVLDPDTFETAVCRIVAVPFDEPVRLSGVTLEAGARRTLRRATVWKGDRCNGADPPLLVWVPGQQEVAWPTGTGERLEPGEPLALRLEYRKTWEDDGARVEDASTLHLRLAPGPTRPPTRRPADGAPLTEPMLLLALLPEAGGEGVLEVIAESPDGEADVLLEVRRPDPLWLGRYELAEPRALRAGTVLRSSGSRTWVELLPLR